MKHLVLALATIATLGSAHAQTYPAPANTASANPARFLLGMGLSAGGDELAKAHYEDGTNVNLHGGGLIYFTAGVDYHFTPTFSVQGTVNYHVDRANARNGDVKFERIPVELIGYYQPNPGWRVGGGVRYSNSPKLSGSGIGSGLDLDFDSSTGAIIETEWFTSAHVGFKVRYVNEKLKPRGGYAEIDGSHVGVSANYYF